MYYYDPFGVMLNQQEGVTNPFKFAGGYLDASGFEQFGVRYYSPSLGRWTQQDPVGGSLGDLNSANRFVYAGDDPVNQVDPSGKDAVACATALLGNGILVGLFGTAGALQIISAITDALIPLAFFGIISFGAVLAIVLGLGLLLVIGELAYFANVVYTNCR